MIKAKFDGEEITMGVGKFFSQFSLSANMWTTLALIPAFFGFLSLYSGDMASALLLFIISGCIDAIDGAVARVTGNVTRFGAFLDGIVDRYVEFFLYIGLLFYMENFIQMEFIMPFYFWISLLIFGAVMPTYVRAYADHRGLIKDKKEQREMGGLIERAERLTILYVGMLFSIFDSNYILYFVALLAILTNFTAIQRIWFVLSRYAKDQDKKNSRSEQTKFT
ncbi:MAG: CDP-alcohol phosphatidyltransferase family protein [Candidatus Altiarchaeales archaeon]|nr:MAG: CDP-alcohol phosphatidyltransferase family protein [Candidatus Altiarchaeales archaeon]RLI94543.1 MAG: CDP-alcohol phosphatidyltransferase family protein [Candidatus Altiarchaeales archaeon]RLI95326.1 MAG: CDP-alcohol phosphatidyltransferase family protein [Candidatus Altiarchaeales archaeon]